MATASPEKVARLWLDAAKRGDAEAMAALYAEERRSEEKAHPDPYVAEVASGRLRAESWSLRAGAGESQERWVTGHVVFRGADGVEHPDNLEFLFVQRSGRWWIASIRSYD